MSVNVSDGFYQAPEYNPVEGIGEIHKVLLNHPGFSHFSVNDFEKIYKALVFAEGIHFREMRKVSESPYFIHPLECVLDNLEEIPFESAEEVAIMILHDVLESNPQCWKKIIVEFGVDVFFSVFLLSKLDIDISKEIIIGFHHHANKLNSENKIRYDNIFGDLFGKLPSDFTNIDYEQSQEMLSGYEKYLKKHCHDMGDIKIQKEIHGLPNFFHFNRMEARIKYRDTINNLKDVCDMKEKEKRSYLERRVPKISILQFVLNRFGMQNELASLRESWISAGGSYEPIYGKYHHGLAVCDAVPQRVQALILDGANNPEYRELIAA